MTEPRAEPSPPEPDRLLTIEQTALRLGVTAKTLRKLVRLGQVPPPVRFNARLVRYKASDIEAALARWKGEVPPTP